MNIRHAGNVSGAMNDIAHADTLRPPAPNPWVDAPTHDGLWWVRGEGHGADTAPTRPTHHCNDLWRIEWIGHEEISTLCSVWRYAPAVPPEAP